MVRLLLIKHADATLGPCGATPMFLAAANGHSSIIRALFDYDPLLLERSFRDNGPTPLCEAVRHNKPRAVQTLLALGARVNISALETVISRTGYVLHADIVRALVDAGVRHRSLLLCSVRTGNAELVRRVLSLGVPVCDLDQQQSSALSAILAKKQDSTVLEVLLEYGWMHPDTLSD